MQTDTNPARQVFVKMVSGRSLALRVFPTQEVAEVKGMIQARVGIPSGQQRLMFDGHDLEDEQCMLNLGICVCVWGGGPSGCSSGFVVG